MSTSSRKICECIDCKPEEGGEGGASGRFGKLRKVARHWALAPNSFAFLSHVTNSLSLSLSLSPIIVVGLVWSCLALYCVCICGSSC